MSEDGQPNKRQLLPRLVEAVTEHYAEAVSSEEPMVMLLLELARLQLKRTNEKTGQRQ